MLVCPQCGASEQGRSTCSQDGSPLADSGQDDLLGSSVGSYRVARLLGRGGMGSVYLGVHPAIGSRVAIKVITPEGAENSSDVQRFFAEARSVNLIQHENIINVLNLAYLPDGRPYIVMEYIDGASLTTWMQNGLGARRLLSMGVEILEALAAAHAKGIVHRDLKPDNVMVTPKGRVKLLDFGIAKLRVDGEAAQHMTALGAVMGTPTYMSPEQALGRPADARSDLYSFGILLYQGLAGHVPFKGNNVFEMFRQHVAAPPPALGAARSDLPAALAHLLERTLAKDPAARPQSALELRAQLLTLIPEVPDTPPPGLANAGQLPHLAQSYPSHSVASASAHPLPTHSLPAHGPSTERPSTERPSTEWPSTERPSTEWAPPAPTSPLQPRSFGVIAAESQPPSAPAALHPSSAPAALRLSAHAARRPSAHTALTPSAPHPSLTALRPSSAPTSTRMPWLLVGVSWILPLGFAALALGFVAFIALRRPSPPPETTAGTGAPERLRAVQRATGDVKIESNPTGASITFAGRYVGQTPLDLGKVEQGSYLVVASLSGHKTRTFTLEVNSGSNTLLCLLSPEPKP